jgi:arylsulfatase A
MNNSSQWSILTLTGALAVGAAPLAESAYAQVQTPALGKPNIVIVMADDLGYGEIQSYNPERGKIPTPYADRLAAEGMMFTDAHSGSAVCTPTRYGLITGRYAWRTRLQQGVVKDDVTSLIAEGRLTLGQLLREQGYHTAAFGKWHLGFTYEETEQAQPAEPVAGRGREARFAHRIGWKVIDSPVTRGFDYYYGFHHSGSMSTVVENDVVVDSYRPVRMLPELGRRSAQYVQDRAPAARQGKPFFLYLALNSPHSPVVPSPTFQGKSGLNAHADFVMETDWALGQVMEALDAAGLARNTLIIFTSDNGTSYGTSRAGRLEQMGHFPSGPLRGYKSDLWDGGHRVPFIARWPAAIAPGSRTHHLVCLTDVIATAADILGVTLPPDAAEDSVSFLSLLRGDDKPVRESVIHHSVSGRFGIRTPQWKLLLAGGSGGWSQPRDRDAANQGLPPVQLYDMIEDYAEQHNLQDQHPEIVRDLLAQLQHIVDAGRSTPGPNQTNDVPVSIWDDRAGEAAITEALEETE